VKKYARSKKRQEIDFFRLLEIQIFQGRNSKTLKNAITLNLFSVFENSFSLNKIGWGWIEQLLKTMPEERPDAQFFSEVITWFSEFNEENAAWYDNAFRMRILQHTGDCPRFDSVRDSCWFDPASKGFSLEEKKEWIFLSNETRQVCELLRRSDPESFIQKIKKIPSESLAPAHAVVSGLEEFLF
jgi:recombinational DNA repair protein (RecF pathway)